MGILAAFDLKQHVKEKMHKNNHTLDLAITRSDDSIIKELCVQDPVISDHHAIHCDLLLQKTSVYKENSQISEDTAHWHQPFHWGHPGLNTLQTGTLRLEHLCCSLRQRPSVTVGKTRPLDNKTCYDLPFSPMLYTGSEGRENKETTLGEEMACHGSTGSSW